MHIGATEDIPLRTLVHGLLLFVGHIAFTIPVIITSTTTKNITHHMTIPQIDMGLTAFVDGCAVHYYTIIFMKFNTVSMHSTTPDRTDLTSTIEAATNDTAHHGDMRTVHIAVSHITATEDVSTQVQLIVTGFNIIQLWHITLIEILSLIIVSTC